MKEEQELILITPATFTPRYVHTKTSWPHWITVRGSIPRSSIYQIDFSFFISTVFYVSTCYGTPIRVRPAGRGSGTQSKSPVPAVILTVRMAFLRTQYRSLKPSAASSPTSSYQPPGPPK